MELFTSADEGPTRKEVEEVAGGIVYQLNGGFEKDAIEIIVDYAYTGRSVLTTELNHFFINLDNNLLFYNDIFNEL